MGPGPPRPSAKGEITTDAHAAAHPHDTYCTNPDHPQIDCVTDLHHITDPGIDGTITWWGTTNPTRGRSIHLTIDAIITSSGLAAATAALEQAHRFLRR